MSAGPRIPWLASRAAATPDAPALRSGGSRRTFAQLDAGAGRAAAVLCAHGIRPGDVVALAEPGGVRFVEWLHAVDRIGATLLPLHLRLSREEWEFQLADAGATRVVCDASLRPEIGAAAARAGVELVDSASHERGVVASPGPDGAEVGDAPLLLVYTSGTTGRPKGALLGSDALAAGARASAVHLGVLPGDCWLGCMPLHHVGGLAILLRCCQYGIPVELHERFDPAALDRAVDRDGVTLVSLVAAMLDRWLEHRGARRSPPSLRAVLVGGGPAPEALLERAAALGVPVLATYGLTEAGSQVATRAPRDRARPLGAGLRALPGTRLRVVREDGRDAAPGEPGEIRVAGPTLMRGYHARPEASARALRDGWLCTGDVGCLDERGGLRVLDRRDDLIVSGGENVYPAEIEAVLVAHPAVREAAVVARASARWGQRPVAWLVPEPGVKPSPDELRGWCRERLAAYKLPDAFEWTTSLPRNALGKLQRARLRADPRDGQAGAEAGSSSLSSSATT